MPKSEKELAKKVHELNICRTHNRSLYGDYGYNQILNVNLVKECLDLAALKKSTIRILDIGCGNGFALNQLKIELEKNGLKNKFEIYGLGVNVYDPLYIPKKSFINKGLTQYELGKNKPFDIIISVYTFQYIWYKLECLEKIYNQLLANNGKAFIHFPGYLMFFSEKNKDMNRNEEVGNKEFASFIQEWKVQNNNPEVSYSVHLYTNIVEDDGLDTEFGVIKFNKNNNKRITFDAKLSGFSMYDEGFIFDSTVIGLSYVSSFYNMEKSKKTKLQKKSIIDIDKEISTPLYRIINVKKKYENINYKFHLAIHPVASPVIIGIYPAAKEELSGGDIPYQQMANLMSNKRIGAVVRCNGLQTEEGHFHEFNDYFVSHFMDYIIENAEDICGSANPDIYLMGYSSGASAIASIAADYSQVKKLLLLAPSHDSDTAKTKHSLNRFTGELYIVTGDNDQVVFPKQAAWFYYQADKSKKRSFVVLDSCEHSFSGKKNREAVLKSPFWAFKDLSDFPPAENLLENKEYLDYLEGWEQEPFWK
ncbi:MAG: hypothetical protein PHF25_04795 [Candidatus Margulisbacteria bacterium]|nr:hypothetical protein [Candidatus Margulisiibacteriota bacterium]